MCTHVHVDSIRKLGLLHFKKRKKIYNVFAHTGTCTCIYRVANLMNLNYTLDRPYKLYF